jgi:hypothetical protein
VLYAKERRGEEKRRRGEEEKRWIIVFRIQKC